jgi:pimeloyl-ACP methyl ester carboxylesterase
MNRTRKILILVAVALMLAVGIKVTAEDVTATLNGTVSFTSTSAPTDVLNVNAETQTVQATEAAKIYGRYYSRITLATTQGSGTAVHVADVVKRDGESLYRVYGNYVGGGDGTGTPPKWVADYTKHNIELIDAQVFGPTLTTDGTQGVSSDPATTLIPLPAGKLCAGAFADGTSVVVVRLPADNAHLNDAVTFTLSHTIHRNRHYNIPQSADYIGSLHATFPALPAPDPGCDTGNLTVQVAAGDAKVVYYRPPNDYMFGTGVATATVPLKITASIGTQSIASQTFTLVRPTIIVSHGFTGDPSSSVDLRNALNAVPGTNAIAIDWSQDNTSGYEVVVPYVHSAIINELTFWRKWGIACTRVDWVGHSMGGVISKWYASDIPAVTIARQTGYPNLVWAPGNNKCYDVDNWGCGRIHRFISIGSPFGGSPLANWVVTQQWVTAAQLKAFVANAPPGCNLNGDLNALADLADSSPATTKLRQYQPKVSWWPIVGQAAPNLTEAQFIPAYKWVTYVVGNEPLASLGLSAAQSDFVVTKDSQVDAHTKECNWLAINIDHLSEPKDASVAGVIEGCEKGLDLFFTSPNARGYVAGHSLFNDGFGGE